jgi:hypothetical protein
MVEGLQGVLEAIIAFLADPRFEGISLKFFIPAEIYDRVFSGFPGKVQSRSVFLRWRSADLISMLAKRYLRILDRTEALSHQEAENLRSSVERAYRSHDGRHLKHEFWYDTKFLPQRITNRRGIEEDCLAYMFRHTHMRPRDLITQMQHIIDEARSRQEFPTVSSQSVIAGVHNDEGLLQILGDSLITHEGRLSEKLVSSARSVFFQRPRIMTTRDLRWFSQELYSLQPLASIDPGDFLEQLLFCGAIGRVENEKPRKDRAELYCKAKFEYLMQGNLPLADRFLYCVHPVMGDVFHMSSPQDRGVIYPMPESEEESWFLSDAELA